MKTRILLVLSDSDCKVGVSAAWTMVGTKAANIIIDATNMQIVDTSTNFT